ncbi:MAG: transglycosylase SLT domain-containing protein, partial [Alphaproteobacteria bacterium]
SRGRLTQDPAYNIQLGQAYLKRMLDKFDGSIILALSAYNAGPRSAARWVRQKGEPGPNVLDMVDWIEQIPYTETRNYVQRVLENRTV